MRVTRDSPMADPTAIIANLKSRLAEVERRLAERTIERDEALAREIGAVEVLEVIRGSPGDLALVFQAILEKAHTLCGASFGALFTYDGERFQGVAHQGTPAPFREYLAPGLRPGPGDPFARMVEGAALSHTHDLSEIVARYPGAPLPRAAVELGGVRTIIVVPLRRDSELLGVVTAYRQEVRPFSDKEIALLQNFAAQAVVAMEKARLINETREALAQQTATAEVLQVINSSPGDLAPVFEAIVDKAHALCGAAYGSVQLWDGKAFRGVAIRGFPEPMASALRQGYSPAGMPCQRIVEGEPVVHCSDLAEIDSPTARVGVELGGVRTVLYVALRKDETLLGQIVAVRTEVRPFTEKEIALLKNFATQAVIAIENARLLSELRESLEQQQAMAEVLGVINANQGNLQPVFDAVLEKAQSLCESGHGTLFLRDGDWFRPAAVRGVPEPIAERLRDGFLGADVPLSRPLLAGERFVHIQDTAPLDHPMVRLARENGARSLLSVPLRQGGRLLGMIVAARFEAPSFSGKQIALLESFAAQAVIAMENARLLDEIRTARDAAQKALAELSATQQQLVVQQKMAALGQLTAGIAHEIKNPLNFVNNFAGLSNELLAELRDAAAPAWATLDAERRAGIDETMALLAGNLEKIAEHGRRADGIVKSMLEHSRGGTGERQTVDLNHLVDEALNLAYHGARAQDQAFNITLERDFAPSLPPIELVPQDITRVCLNLFSNGFYAAARREKEGVDRQFAPRLKVTTRDIGRAVEIRIRDNGTGIAPEAKGKLFQPFFTTKPTGEGTGLGLSISYDIVTQQHGGSIEVDSRVNEFAEFTVRLPRSGEPR